MTIAISLKVHDGVVLATDSASTLTGPTPDGKMAVMNVYNNANKIVNLVKGLPVGVMTWGAGAIGPVGVTTIFKDLRAMFAGTAPGPGGEDWTLLPETLNIADVADKVKRYVIDDLYTAAFGSASPAPELGMVVAGYSAGGDHAEEYRIVVDKSGAKAPEALRPGAECGFVVGGQPQVIARLILGVDPQLKGVLEKGLGIPANQSAQAVQIIQQHLQMPVVQDPMPFQDALDLARFMVETTIQMSRFMPGAATVGGPVEVAGITKHEGFKWVSRKHYYAATMNPKE